MALVTVVIPARNEAPHIDAALRSILAQSLSDLEVIVIDDASTDETGERVNRLGDSRVRLLRNENNLGVSGSLNRALDLASGGYVARMDADDVAHADRLARQIAFLETHPEVGAVGSWARFVEKFAGHRERKPVGAAHARAWLLFDNPLIHSTVVMRRDLLERCALRYDPAWSRTEDFDLWMRLSEHAQLDNVPEVLLDFRVRDGGVTGTARGEMDEQAARLLRRRLALCGRETDLEESGFHRAIGQGAPMKSPRQLRDAAAWLDKLLHDEKLDPGVDPGVFRAVVADVWFRLCRRSAHLGWSSWRACWAAPFAAAGGALPADRVRFALAAGYHHLRRSGGSRA